MSNNKFIKFYDIEEPSDYLQFKKTKSGKFLFCIGNDDNLTELSFYTDQNGAEEIALRLIKELLD